MAAHSTTRGHLRRLAALRPERGMVLSIFFNLDPSEFATPAARATEVNSVVTAAAHKVEEAEGLEQDARIALRRDLDRVRDVLQGSDVASNGTHGLAVYACGPEDLQEVDRIEGDTHGQHDQGGWSQARFQRSVEQEKLNHLGEALDTLFARFKRRPFDHLLVGAPDELVAEVEQRLHPYLRDRLAGRLHVDVENSSAEEIRAAAADVVDAHVAEVEREALDRFKQGVGRGDRGAAGPAAVMEALEQARVETLLLAEDFDAPELDDAVERAITQSARILVIRHHDDLIPHAGIGAVLRF